MSITLYKKIFQDIGDYFFGTKCFSYCKDIERNLYPIDLDFTLLEMDTYYRWIDEHGIPFRYYKSVGKQYNPTRVAAFGLANYNRWAQVDSDEARFNFLIVADWFLKNQQARYEYNFDWKGLSAPWISCMAQGEATSVLVRAYQVTNDKRYLEVAKSALQPFLTAISNKGVQSKINNEFVFLEEFPTTDPVHVLNGFLYALIGLIEYCEVVTADRELSCLRDQLCITLEKNILNWGEKYWSYYEIPSDYNDINYCTPKYHNLHISQLMYVTDKMQLASLDVVILRWKKGANSFWTRCYALFCKIKFRLKNKAQR